MNQQHRLSLAVHRVFELRRIVPLRFVAWALWVSLGAAGASGRKVDGSISGGGKDALGRTQMRGGKKQGRHHPYQLGVDGSTGREFVIVEPKPPPSDRKEAARHERKLQMTWNREEGLKEARRSTTMVVAVVALLVTLGDPAWATRTLSTGYLTTGEAISAQASGPVDTFECSVVGTKPKPIDDVTFELVRADGTTIVALGPLTLNPGDPRTIYWESAETCAYCRVSGKISRHRTHITVCNGGAAGGPCFGSTAQSPVAR